VCLIERISEYPRTLWSVIRLYDIRMQFKHGVRAYRSKRPIMSRSVAIVHFIH